MSIVDYVVSVVVVAMAEQSELSMHIIYRIWSVRRSQNLNHDYDEQINYRTLFAFESGPSNNFHSTDIHVFQVYKYIHVCFALKTMRVYGEFGIASSQRGRPLVCTSFPFAIPLPPRNLPYRFGRLIALRAPFASALDHRIRRL